MNMHRLVMTRTLKKLRQIFLEPKYRLDKPDMNLCIWSANDSTLPEFMKQLGYRKVTHVTELNEAPEPGLLICDGDHVGVEELKSVVAQLEEGEPILLVHFPIQSKVGSENGGLDPFEIGKPRIHSIHHWYDVIYGSENRRHIRERPVVRVRRL
jgi:hypothetical protein